MRHLVDNIIEGKKGEKEMLFIKRYQSSYCEKEQSWYEQKSEYGSIAMRSFDKRKPGMRS